MKLAAAASILILCAGTLAGQIVLEPYGGNRAVKTTGVEVVEAEAARKEAGGASLFTAGRFTMDETQNALDCFDLIFETGGRRYSIPYTRLCNRVLASYGLIAPKGIDGMWIVEISAVPGGGQGPQFPGYTWFVIQLVEGVPLLLPVLAASSEEGDPELVVETSVLGSVRYVKLRTRGSKYSQFTQLSDRSGVFQADSLLLHNSLYSAPWAWVVDTLNVRSEPNAGSRILGRLRAGERIDILDVDVGASTIDGITASWYMIASKSNTALSGWVFGGWLK